MLKIRNILKSYKREEVLNIEFLNIAKGECVALLGNNGAGKTTLLKSIVDLVKLDQGSIEMDSFQVNKTEEWKNNTSIFLSSNLLIPYLTPEEYLIFVGKARNISIEKIKLFILENKKFYRNELFNNNKPIKHLSQGNRQKVGLLSVLLAKEGFFLLDEPYANLDISSKKMFSEIVTEILKMQNSTFMISSHNIDDVLEVATRLIIIKKGKIISDTPSTMLTKKEIELMLNLN